MPVFWLNDADPGFPHPSLAEPGGGLLAVGGDLQPARLVQAYSNGIFPWFEEGGYFYWYAPDPRCVLFPAELVVHKSMRSIFNRQKFRYTLDTRFEDVIRACAGSRRAGQNGTWISDAFVEGYIGLHREGLAHSVEVWAGEELVGGLYGVSLGRIFFGESMFARVTNASKAGFITLVRALQHEGFRLVDCQQDTEHLTSLGARNISRELFLEYLAENVYGRTLQGRWGFTAEGGIAVGSLQ